MELRMYDKYKCISVQSLTYARKAAEVLRRKGIDSSISKQAENNKNGCARCVRIKEKDLRSSMEILKQNGVLMSGEVYDA